MLNIKVRWQERANLNAKYVLGVYESTNISEIRTHNGFQYFREGVYVAFRLHSKNENNPFKGSSFLMVSAHFLTAIHL